MVCISGWNNLPTKHVKMFKKATNASFRLSCEKKLPLFADDDMVYIRDAAQCTLVLLSFVVHQCH